jgi:phosphoadenosine phosphosulfate reductase
VVIYDLAVKSGVKFDAHYCVSPIDPPQIYKFIKENYPAIQWDRHAKGWWQKVIKKGLPLRHSRWCCEFIKEAGGKGRTIILGNRREEGKIRKHQKDFEQGTRWGKVFVRPILTWSTGEVWEYIGVNNLPYCSLYDEGFKRLGCVLCPFSGEIEREIRFFPKVVANWRRACDRIIENRKATGRHYKLDCETGQELFDWWIKRK